MDQTTLDEPTRGLAFFLPERFRSGLGDRATGIAVALVLEGLLLYLLLSLGWSIVAPEKPKVVEVQFKASEISKTEDKTPEADQSAPKPPQRTTEAAVEKPVETVPAPVIPTVIPIPTEQPTVPPPPVVGPRPIQPIQPGKQSYGPPNTGSSGSMSDSRLVGTAPNGEPLYAASWYRKPRDGEFNGYLSTATPGWGLIACRTAPDYRVEDCVPIEEHPEGSMINRAMLAAAWQFRVRPPRLGGRSLVGAWVRIRFDYNVNFGSGDG